MVSLGQRLKTAKRCTKRLCDSIKNVVCKKTGPKNRLIFEKWEHFKNGQNWPRYMGYSPCKMVSLGQKLKKAKRCEKRLDDHIRAFLCKKQLQKTHKSLKTRAFHNGQSWPRCQNFKTLKTYEKRLCDHVRNIVSKKPLQKTNNIGQTRAFSKWP